ncbi:hypothetical protein QZH41_000406 [Actinostola sp. cb2023]|nr:hypothetical protein QZH41_000406 [Actinostola sp. cb2023]
MGGWDQDKDKEEMGGWSQDKGARGGVGSRDRRIDDTRMLVVNRTTTTTTNDSLQTSPSQRYHTTIAERCIGISFTTVLMVSTLFFNTLVCLTLIKRKRTFNASYVFILNLCFANCLIGVFSMPWWIMLELYSIDDLIAMLGHSMQFFLFVDIVGGVASILSLTAISVVRWLTVTHPLDWMVVLTHV